MSPGRHRDTGMRGSTGPARASLNVDRFALAQAVDRRPEHSFRGDIIAKRLRSKCEVVFAGGELFGGRARGFEGHERRTVEVPGFCQMAPLARKPCFALNEDSEVRMRLSKISAQNDFEFAQCSLGKIEVCQLDAKFDLREQALARFTHSYGFHRESVARLPSTGEARRPSSRS